MARLKKYTKGDASLISIVILLLAFGVLMVYDASVVRSIDAFGGQYHFLILQLAWVLIGLVLGLIFYKIDYRKLRPLAFPFLIISLLFLIFVLIPTPFTPEISGAHRWIYFSSSMRFQPSELAKLALVIYLAVVFSDKKRLEIKLLLAPLIVFGGLVLAEPDFGTTLVIASIAVAAYFAAGAPFAHFLVLVPLGVIGGLLLLVLSPYRKERVLTFLNPATSDPQGAGYQIKQLLIALGSGGFWGLGVGKSRQKYDYLPAVNTDSIFAVVGEEFGFIGASLLVLAFAFVIYHALNIARRAPDKFGRILASGIAVWFGSQVVLNLFAVTGMAPLTGIPLPFISYGGSSLVTMLVGFGILLNISRQAGRG